MTAKDSAGQASSEKAAGPKLYYLTTISGQGPYLREGKVVEINDAPGGAHQKLHLQAGDVGQEVEGFIVKVLSEYPQPAEPILGKTVVFAQLEPLPVLSNNHANVQFSLLGRIFENIPVGVKNFLRDPSNSRLAPLGIRKKKLDEPNVKNRRGGQKSSYGELLEWLSLDDHIESEEQYLLLIIFNYLKRVDPDFEKKIDELDALEPMPIDEHLQYVRSKLVGVEP